MAGSHFTGPLLNMNKSGGVRQWYQGQPFGGASDPNYVTYFNDFINTADYATGDWTITTTEAGAGDATEAIGTNVLNGTLVITNDAADDDLDALQLNEETFACTAGKQLWFETRCKLSDATQSDLFFGLNITDTTMLTTSASVGFLKSDGAATISTRTISASTTTTSSAIGTLVDDTYVKLGFHWDGVSSVKFFIDRGLVATHTANIPTVNLAISFHLQNGEAVAKVLTIDYIYCSQER